MCAARSHRRCAAYLAVVLALLAMQAGLLELLIRTRLVAPAHEAKAVHAALFSPRRDVVLGDSQVSTAPVDGLAVAFAGVDGASFHEIGLVAAAFRRFHPAGRTVVAAGPQMFSQNRQPRLYAMTPGAFRHQVLPFPVGLLEPVLTQDLPGQIATYFSLVLKVKFGLSIAHAATLDPRDRAAIDAAIRAHGDGFYLRLPAALRARLNARRASEQNPVPQPRASQSWADFSALLQSLLAGGDAVCVLITPITREYEDVLARAYPRYAAMIKAVRNKATTMRLPFVDYHDIMDNRRLELFSNQDHLNGAGRALFWPKAMRACFDGSASDR